MRGSIGALLDEQAVRVAGLLQGWQGAQAPVVRRFGATDAWLVSRGDAQVVLKRGRSEQDEADVTWEHEHLHRLAGAGFPASVPLPAFDGQSWVRADDRIWAALSYLPGRPLVAEQAPDMEAAGALLARYHQAARIAPLATQRPTAAGLTQLDDVMPWRPLRAALGDVSKLGAFVAHLQNLETSLKHLGYSDLEHLVIHGDATNDNLIVDGKPPHIVGLIDFGSAHRSPWIFDIGAALWRSGRFDLDGVEYDPGRIQRFVAGYLGEAPIPRRLAWAIPLMMHARGLQLIYRRLRRLPSGQPVAPMPDVLLTFDRLTWIRKHADDLEEGIGEALKGRSAGGERRV